MRIDDSFYLGFITKKFGYKGEVVGVFDVDNPKKYAGLESVFLLLDEKLIPFFIDKISFRPNSNQAIIKFKGADTEKQAEYLIDSKMYLPLEMLPPLSGNQFYFHEVEGFDVYDMNWGHIGKINSILDYPGNPLFQIIEKSIEILIPVKDEYIKKVDRKSGQITVETPDGLLDIYLNAES